MVFCEQIPHYSPMDKQMRFLEMEQGWGNPAFPACQTYAFRELGDQ